MLTWSGTETKELLWADIGERLGLTVAEMRDIKATFGDILGISLLKGVPEELLSAIGFIVRQRRLKVPDEEISQQLESVSNAQGWTEEALARLESAAGLATEARTLVAEDETRSITPAPTASTKTPAGEDGSPEGETEPAFRPTLTLVRTTKEPIDPEDEPSLHDLIMDLRRDLHTQLSAQRADILRLNQSVQKLAIEVRDMRYALLLGFTRKDRKKGHKGMSNLLLG